MSGTLTIKKVVIGTGQPKICVPLVGATLGELLQEAEGLKRLAPDLVEWRADFYEQVEDHEAVLHTLGELRAILADLPLIFTFRSAREGGEREISAEYYAALNKAAARSGNADLIDVELFSGEAQVKELVAAAHEHGVFVIISNHNFHKTPPAEEIVERLRAAQALGGDLPKIAVMPQQPGDVLTLLAATLQMKEHYADRPIITMSMAGTGAVSRLSGELFGSAVTFGAGQKASAPGQMAVAELRQALALLHRGL
ncbi:type I 3-dehydroquinate dehydratase [Paenibacillus donghaensis]|uniref:3-dehydroquinate dehydratase n=1 Tax=Paenibacillus donghaensis TaxID=414771 RepID=A0A2Z2KN66_9BACL|nr:type I 3-dehydroquinate dehydratase [Paenibacillus donghaensis]ASA25885.1 type I 3-dehydroquinate dehydratase [Paenibacillus donghaensis]